MSKYHVCVYWMPLTALFCSLLVRGSCHWQQRWLVYASFIILPRLTTVITPSWDGCGCASCSKLLINVQGPLHKELAHDLYTGVDLRHSQKLAGDAAKRCQSRSKGGARSMICSMALFFFWAVAWPLVQSITSRGEACSKRALLAAGASYFTERGRLSGLSHPHPSLSLSRVLKLMQPRHELCIYNGEYRRSVNSSYQLVSFSFSYGIISLQSLAMQSMCFLRNLLADPFPPFYLRPYRTAS